MRALADCLRQDRRALADCLLQGRRNVADCLSQGWRIIADCVLKGRRIVADQDSILCPNGVSGNKQKSDQMGRGLNEKADPVPENTPSRSQMFRPQDA